MVIILQSRASILYFFCKHIIPVLKSLLPKIPKGLLSPILNLPGDGGTEILEVP
jgi:hypothetical protein